MWNTYKKHYVKVPTTLLWSRSVSNRSPMRLIHATLFTTISYLISLDSTGRRHLCAAAIAS